MNDGSLVFDTKIDTSNFEQGNRKMEQSTKTTVARMAAEYRKLGLSQSDSFKRAWSEVDRPIKAATDRVVLQGGRVKKALNVDSEAAAVGRNMNTLKSQAGGLTASFGKLGLAVGAAFVVRGIVDFGKQSVALASDLAEVQNVVDVSFGTMAYKMEQFAEAAIQSFGLSRLEAKRTGSTFMAMAAGMGMAQDSASDMAISLTGLSADMASFHNKNQSETKTALSSIFTGETETLKGYGILITEVNLQEFARQQGITKSINKMTQLEKVQLRYNYVMNATKLAQGDFARTSGSWANQVRILTEQWKEFATILGQVLTKVILPVVKALNTAVAGMIKFAKAAAKALGVVADSKPGENTGQIGEDAENAGAGFDDMADSADKAKKAVKSLAGVDEINKLAQETNLDIGSGGIDDSIGDISVPDISTDNIDKAEIAVSRLQQKLQELQEQFAAGFDAGKGDDFTSSIERTKAHIDGIKDSIVAIATDPAVAASADNFANKFAYAAGQVAGSMASIGATIAENLTGGVDKYLFQNAPFIKDRIAGIFDASAEIAEQTGNTAEAAAEIFTVFRSQEAKNATSDLIGIFSNGFLGATQVILMFVGDFQKLFTQPIIDNVEGIKTAFANTIAPIGTVLNTLNTAVKDTFEKIIAVYQEKIAPMFDRLTTGFSSIMGAVLTTYNTYIAPVLQNLADGFATLWQDHIQPAIDKAVEFFGKIGELIGVIYTNVIVPFGLWFSETILPLIAPVIEAVGNFFLEAGKFISDFVGGAMETLGGLIDFFIGVFSGDWDKAWQGIKDMFSGAWNGMLTNLGNILDMIYSALEVAWEVIKTGFTVAWEAICAVFKAVWDNISAVVTGAIDGIKNGISTGLENISDTFTRVFGAVKKTVEDVFNGIWNFIKGIVNTILGAIESMCNGVIDGFNGMVGAMNNMEFDVPDWVPGIGGKTFGFALPELRNISIPRLATGTVVPANYGEFTAILGDNKREPEVVSPLSTIRQAVTEAISALQGRGGGDIVIPVYLDGALIYEAVLSAEQRKIVRSNGRG